MIATTYIDADTFTVEGDQTSIFHEGRRARCYCGVDEYKYGTIMSSSYSSPSTTVNLTTTSDNLTSNLESVKYGIVGKDGNESLPVHDHSGDEGSGGSLCSLSGWFDDGANFRVTVVNGIITTIGTTVSGGYNNS